MHVVRWTFEDPTVGETYTLDINPREGGTPARSKNIAYAATAAPDGKVLMFEGRENPPGFEISGTILTEEQLTAFQHWYDKRHQIRVTDDLGRQTWVYITAFEPKRAWAVNHPWRHSFTMRATVLDWS